MGSPSVYLPQQTSVKLITPIVNIHESPKVLQGKIMFNITPSTFWRLQLNNQLYFIYQLNCKNLPQKDNVFCFQSNTKIIGVQFIVVGLQNVYKTNIKLMQLVNSEFSCMNQN